MSPGTHQALPDARNEDVIVHVGGDAKISVLDSAFLVGDGVWEGLRLDRGRFVHDS